MNARSIGVWGSMALRLRCWGLVLLTAVCVTVTAETDPVCRIGSTDYATIDLALAAVQDDETIELLCDCELNATVSLTKRFTLTSAAGGSYTLTRHNAGTQKLEFASGADVTLTSITLDGLNNEYLLNLTDASATVTIGAGACLTNFYGAPVSMERRPRSVSTKAPLFWREVKSPVVRASRATGAAEPSTVTVELLTWRVERSVTVRHRRGKAVVFAFGRAPSQSQVA